MDRGIATEKGRWSLEVPAEPVRFFDEREPLVTALATRARGNERCSVSGTMVAPNLSPPRPATPPPPASTLPPAPSSTVVPIRPKPPLFTPTAGIARPVIIEEDVVQYLAKAPLEQRWRILSRAAMLTSDEGTPTIAPPPPERPSTTVPPPSGRRHVEIVDPTPTPTPIPAMMPPPMPPPMPPSRSTLPPPRPSRVSPPTPRTPPRATPELTLFESARAGARSCLETAMRAVPSLAGLVHLRDRATGDLVVVHAQGPRAEHLLRTRTSQADALVARAAGAGKPMAITYGAEPGAEKTRCPRHELFDPWSVVLVPVMHGGRLLALFEMIDPFDGNPFDAATQGALADIAGRLGGFLAEHGVGEALPK